MLSPTATCCFVLARMAEPVGFVALEGFTPGREKACFEQLLQHPFGRLTKGEKHAETETLLSPGVKGDPAKQ